MSLTTSAIHQRASNKAFAKVEMCQIIIQQDEHNLKTGNYGADITLEQAKLIAEGNKIELEVWNYIAKLIETNE
jgi:hypothetical protein